MPSLVKYLWLVVLVGWPAGLTAQTLPPSNPGPRQAEMLPPAYTAQPDPQPTAAANQAIIPLPPPRHNAPVPLPPPGRSNHASTAKSGGLPSATTMAGSLAVVLGLFFAVVLVMRGAKPKGSVLLPGEVVEVLGRARWPADSRCTCCAAGTSCCWSRSLQPARRRSPKSPIHWRSIAWRALSPGPSAQRHRRVSASVAAIRTPKRRASNA